MSPLVMMRLGDQNQTSAINRNGGKNPKFSDVLIFDKEIDEDTLYIEMWEYDETGDNDFIGIGYCSVTPALL